jgi:hypothetical protein
VNEAAIRGFLKVEATRSQYLDGVADPTRVCPDVWELDQRYPDLPGRDQGSRGPRGRRPD